MFRELTIPIPGALPPQALLDIETVKVPTEPGYMMPNGERLRQRWSVVACGIALGETITLHWRDPLGELELLNAISARLRHAPKITYLATREFDEMVLRGRFTTARRAHLPKPAWPAIPLGETFRWQATAPRVRYERSLSDVASASVPDLWWRGSSKRRAVLIHLLRDVAELILLAAPNRANQIWCNNILISDPFARLLVPEGV